MSPSGRPQLIMVGIAMVAIQLAVLTLIADRSGVSSGGVVIRVGAMLALTGWFLYIWNRTKAPKLALVTLAIAPAMALGYLAYSASQGPTAREVIRATVAEHCVPNENGLTPLSGLMEYNEEVMVVGGKPRGSGVVNAGRHFQELLDAAVVGEDLVPERIVCIRSEGGSCGQHDVALFEIGSQGALETAVIRQTGACGKFEDGERFYRLGSSSSPMMEQLVSQMYSL